MKKTANVLLTLLLIFTITIPALSAPINPINWNVLVSDPEGDSTAPFGILDLKSIEGAQESDDLYFRFTIWESGLSFFESTSFFWIDVDPDSEPPTGHNNGILQGRDYAITLNDTGTYISDGTGIIPTGRTDLEAYISDYIAEIIIPLSELSMYDAQPNRIEFMTILDVSKGSMDVSNVPIPSAAFLLASGLIGLVGIRRKK